MKFKIDENLPAEIKDDLLAAGHDALTVVEQGLPIRSSPKRSNTNGASY
jgi:hypothetical protein